MTRWEQAFFLLLRCGLWEQKPQSLELFPLSDDEWMLIYNESRRQTVQGLLYRGFQQLPERLFPPQAVLMHWLADTDAAEQLYRQSVMVTADSWKLLCKSGQTPVLQKGLAVGLLYEHPEERLYGDVDWYVPDMAGAVKQLKQHGLPTMPHPDSDVAFSYHGTEVELHHQLIDIQSTSQRYNVDLVIREEGTMPLTLPNGTTVRTPAPLLTLVLLQAHLLKHIMMMGVGLRQFCDLARAYHVLHNRANDSRLVDYYCRLNLLRWTQVTHTFLNVFLGVPMSELPCLPNASDKECLRLARAILRWGNFGQHTTAWLSVGGHSFTKFATAKQVVRNLPLAMSYAPRETAQKLKSIILRQRHLNQKKNINKHKDEK